MSKITNSTYRRLPESTWVGTEVRLLVDLTSKAGDAFKQGDVLTIIRKYKGFELRSADGRRIKGVSYLLVEVV